MSSRESQSDPAPPAAMSRGAADGSAKDRWTSGDAYEIWMGRWSRLLADDFLQWLTLPPVASWLDVCCGTGILSVAIAERTRPARVVGVDRAPSQIEFARRHHSARGMEFHVAEATALPFADASFDACVSGLGLNFVAQPLDALREMRRVTRPSGTIACYVWEYSGQVRFLREFWDAAAAVDPGAAAYDQGRRFPICTVDGLRAAYDEAGLGGAVQYALEITTRFANFDDYWSPFLLGQGSAPVYLASRDERIRTAIRDRLKAALPVNADGSISLDARALAIRAPRR
jgi:SAM-dependent methyltransferase